VRLIRRLILFAALAAGAVYLKQLLDEEQQPAPIAEPPAPKPEAGGSNGSEGATKAELYEQAQRLDIEGRSKMTKAELERAIRAAD
jgi:hypothetical protein